jgi:hypothetical protein
MHANNERAHPQSAVRNAFPVFAARRLTMACRSTNNMVRNLGTRLLAEILSKSPIVSSISGQQVQILLDFFSERMKDEPCVREVLRASEGLLDTCENVIRGNADAQKAALNLMYTMLRDVHVQALSLSDRGRTFAIVDIVAFKLKSGVLGEEFVDGFTNCMDGERDPRNLRMCFSIIPKIMTTAGLIKQTGDEKRVDALFNVFSCYFPITFTPPPNDTVGITTEMLKTDMLECLTCTPLFAPAAVDLALSKLAAAEVASARLDSMDLIASLSTKYGARVGLAGYARRVWSALRMQIVEGSTDEVVIRARSCLRHILRKAGEEQQQGSSSSNTDSTDNNNVAQEIWSAMKMQCLVELRTPDDPRCRKSTTALQCAIGAHPLVAAEVLPVVIPQLCNGYMEGPNMSDARRQTFLHILLECIMSVKSLMESEYMQSGSHAHPLEKYIDGIHSTACSAVINPIGNNDGEEGSQGPGLEIMCELTLQKLLDEKLSIEAASHVTTYLISGGVSASRSQRIATKFAAEEGTRKLVLDVMLPWIMSAVLKGEGGEAHHYAALAALSAADAQVCVCVFVFVCACVSVCLCACVRVAMNVCLCVCVCVYIYIYIYIYTDMSVCVSDFMIGGTFEHTHASSDIHTIKHIYTHRYSKQPSQPCLSPSKPTQPQYQAHFSTNASSKSRGTKAQGATQETHTSSSRFYLR